MELKRILEKLGLTSQESKVYLALSELQESQTGLLCRTTNIASSNIYNILNKLITKGLVNYRIQNNIKIFMPAPPETLNEFFLEKQRVLDEERKQVSSLISQLKKRKEFKKPISQYKYFEGLTGVKSLWHEINTVMDPSTTIKIHTAKKESYQKFVDFYNTHHILRKKKKVKAKMIFPLEDRSLAKKRADSLTSIKFKKLDNDAEWGVIGDIFFIHYIIGKDPRGFLIHDKTFAKTFEQAFDSIWDQSQK